MNVNRLLRLRLQQRRLRKLQYSHGYLMRRKSIPLQEIEKIGRLVLLKTQSMELMRAKISWRSR